jgi:hypothetical protein
MGTRHLQRKKIDTIEKLAELFVESMGDLRSDMNDRFDVLGDKF